MRGMVEHIAVQDIFCSGIGAIERLDGNLLRVWLYASQMSESDTQEKVLVAKIVVSMAHVPAQDLGYSHRLQDNDCPCPYRNDELNTSSTYPVATIGLGWNKGSHVNASRVAQAAGENERGFIFVVLDLRQMGGHNADALCQNGERNSRGLALTPDFERVIHANRNLTMG